MASRVGIALLVVCLLFLGYVLYTSVEMVEEKTNQGFSIKALRNPYLAASQFLERRGHQVVSSRSMKQLDNLPDGGTVFISDSRQLRKQERVDTLIDWMKRGGHLIVGAQTIKDSEQNVLLKHFGISKEHVECKCDEKQESPEETQARKLSELLREANKEIQKGTFDNLPAQVNKDIPEDELTKLYFENINHPVKIHFSRDYALIHPLLETTKNRRKKFDGPRPFYWEENQAGIQFMQFYVGDGLLSVLSQGSIWNSRSIGEVDHAFLLSLLTDQRKDVLLVYGAQMPTIFELWRKHAPELFIASLLWLLVWLFYRAKRFGTLQEPEVAVRRSLDEHILASSGHLWRQKQRQPLVASVVSSILRKIEQKNAGFSRMDEQQQVKWVSEQSGLSPSDVATALFSREITSEDQFCRIMAILQQLRNRL